jgi:protein-L-isoaspartate(D-aspartate) O-methyltransferase
MHLTMNLEQARYNMVEQQIRPSEPLREDVRELLHLIRREDFAPTGLRHLAFADCRLPLGHGAAMLSPRVEAAALQALKLRKHENVLQIGTGSGYLAALLAVHADHVLSFEIEPELAATARANLQRAGIGNVSVEVGDGFAATRAGHDQYDVIVVAGGMADVPADLLAKLKVGGRLFGFFGAAPALTARLVTRVGDIAYRSQGLFETDVELLCNAPQRDGFVF